MHSSLLKMGSFNLFSHSAGVNWNFFLFLGGLAFAILLRINGESGRCGLRGKRSLPNDRSSLIDRRLHRLEIDLGCPVTVCSAIEWHAKPKSAAAVTENDAQNLFGLATSFAS